MSSLPLWLGTMACALAVSTALAARELPVRRRLLLVLAALALAPILVASDNWDGERVRELRESPALLAAGAAAATALVAALVLLFRSRPRAVPLAVVATMAFRIPIDLGDDSVNLLLPLYAVLAAALLAALLAPERIVPREEPSSGPAGLLGGALALFLLFYAVQSAYADGISAAVENVGFFFVPFAALYLLLVRAPWDRRLLQLAVGVLVLEALVVALVAFGQYATREVFWNEKVMLGNEAHQYFRVNSLFFDPNIMGRYLAVAMVALAGIVAWGRRRPSGLATVGFVILLLALAITFSQSSMLALIAGVLVLIAARLGIVRGLLAGAATAIVLGLSLVAFGGAGLTDETTGRTGLVSGGLELAGERPIIGNGSGTFPTEFEQRFGGGEGIATESHTEPVTVLAEQGLVGMVPYLLLLGVATAALWRAAALGMAGSPRPDGAILLAAFAAMVVHSLGYAAFLTDPITWLLLALAAVVPLSAASTVRSERAAHAEPEPV